MFAEVCAIPGVTAEMLSAVIAVRSSFRKPLCIIPRRALILQQYMRAALPSCEFTHPNYMLTPAGYTLV